MATKKKGKGNHISFKSSYAAHSTVHKPLGLPDPSRLGPLKYDHRAPTTGPVDTNPSNGSLG
jgi:hypothetical protein